MNFSIIARTAFVLAALPTAAFAQHRGSMEDQMACTPDVYRLCAAQVPDEDAIVKCLEQHKPMLSAACKQVFSQPASGSKPAQSDDDD